MCTHRVNSYVQYCIIAIKSHTVRMGLGGWVVQKARRRSERPGSLPVWCLHRSDKKTTMENSLSHRWRNIPPLPITEAQRPFGQTHPTDFRFVPLPFSLKAQDHREALCPPLQRDAFRRTHDFIQLISKAITFNQTKRGRNMTTLAP